MDIEAMNIQLENLEETTVSVNLDVRKRPEMLKYQIMVKILRIEKKKPCARKEIQIIGNKKHIIKSAANLRRSNKIK